jgi:hypothetical protein
MCLRVRARRFSQRGTGLIEQTMAILRFPGLVLTRQLFDWGTPTGLHGFYRFLPPNPSSDPYTPEMEIYKAFANVSGGMRLPGSGWSDNRDATGIQVEAVCVGNWVKPPCPSKPCRPPSCDRLKIALVNGGRTDTAVGLRVRFCDALAPGTAVSLDATKPGAQRAVVPCGNTSQPLLLKAGALTMVECECALPHS